MAPDCAWIHNELKRHRHVTTQDRADLLEILDDRVSTGSTLIALIASQLPVDAWHAYLGEPTLADTLLRFSINEETQNAVVSRRIVNT